jgi:hypothetical protein
LRESASGRLETEVVLADSRRSGSCSRREGYPPAPSRKGDVIDGSDAAAAHDGVTVFHAAPRRPT